MLNMKSTWKLMVAVSVTAWAMALAPALFASCGNTDPHGPAGPCDDDGSGCGSPAPPSCSGPNPFNVFTANAHRKVTDLRVRNGAGEHPLAWTRHANSRFIAGPKYFGAAQNWRHSYQWEMADASANPKTSYLDF